MQLIEIFIKRVNIRFEELKRSEELTHEKVAQDMGVSRSAVTDLLKGRSKTVELKTVGRIAHALKCSPAYLLGEQDATYRDPTPEELVAHFSKAVIEDETRLAAVLGVLDANYKLLPNVIHILGINTASADKKKLSSEIG